MIAHIVFFEPRTIIDEATRRSFALKMAAAGRQIGAIKRGYVGRALSVDAGYQRNMGESPYSYAAVLEFEDRAGLVAYLNHPLHAEIGQLFWQACERTAIMEVETRELDDPELSDFLV